MLRFRGKNHKPTTNHKNHEEGQNMDKKQEDSNEHATDRVAAGVGGCAPATAREGEGIDPRP